jgi:hypothetical protein
MGRPAQLSRLGVSYTHRRWATCKRYILVVNGWILINCTVQVYRCCMMCIEYWWVTILPGITTLAAVGMSCFARRSIT